MKFKWLLMSIAVLALLVIGCGGNGEANENDAKTKGQTDQQMTSESTDKTTDTTAKRTEIRSPDNPIVTIDTDYGSMTLELYHDVAPTHVDSFLARAKDGFYEGTIFHRVIDGFMIQGGDPKGTGMGNAGYFLPAEFSDLPHEEGTLSMARSRDVNSASCQFFICLARKAYLDGQYTVFGHLLKGYDVLHKIGSVEVTAPPHNPKERSRPVEDIHIQKIYLSDADGNPLEKETE
jgi:cyclophilin family peptidyl-prolyl cis-trans isomerase